MQYYFLTEREQLGNERISREVEIVDTKQLLLTESIVFGIFGSRFKLNGNSLELLYSSGILGMTLNCMHILIVTGSFVYRCVMRPASQRYSYTVVFIYES